MTHFNQSNLMLRHLISLMMVLFSVRIHVSASNLLPDSIRVNDEMADVDSITMYDGSSDSLRLITMADKSTRYFNGLGLNTDKNQRKSLYELPYSVTGSQPNWKRLWLNTGVLGGAFVGTLLVLECLPEDATSWNRAEIQSVAPFKRWFRNIFKKGFEWDHDKFYFNYILHPYAGAVYYMGARSCGFNAWQSLLYCTCISTFFWEFGIEAFMERPSIQDLFITPLVGSLIGEGFYKIKRSIVNNGYRLAGSPVLGNIVVFLVDPINEVIGLFAGNECRQIKKRQVHDLSSSMLFQSETGVNVGLSLSYKF